MPIPETKVTFNSAGGTRVLLEGLLGCFADQRKHRAAVLCHPGAEGQMGCEYPVIASCADALRLAGFVTLRFNFRGVQGSEGTRSQGLHESEDVLGAVQFLRQQADVDPASIYLLGNSFGAWMVLETLHEDKLVAGVVCVVLPLALLPRPMEWLSRDHRPKLFVAAERDQLCGLATLEETWRTWADPKELIILEGTDHFLGIGPSSTDRVNRASEIADAVVLWLRGLTSKDRQI